jgi:predicted O-linked N-acetylglucosamine transferase (SPINDLY family)
MQATHGFHHHFGALTDEFLQKIRSVLDQHGVAQDKLIYHGTVSSLSAALRLISNPVFVPSFPVGAGLTTIEMCANGVPMLVHEKGREMDGKISKKLISSLIPNSAIRWTRDETLGSMCALMKNNYVKFSELSRSHYIKFYDSALVADGFKKILSE